MNKQLTQYRKEIDNIDQQLIKLLDERIGVVKQVGELKEQIGDGKTIIRPGREASMVRDIIAASKSEFPKAAIAQIWRMIISGSVNIEEKTSIAVFEKTNHRECFWLAREYFGSFSKMNNCDSVKQVIESVASKEATIGVIPLWGEGAARSWWIDCAENYPNIKIFARLPFIKNDDSSLIPIVAIANVDAEDSGDDNSLFSFKTPPNTGIDAIEPLLLKAGFKCYLQAVNHGKTHTDYLIEIAGFVILENDNLQKAIKKMAGDVLEVNYLGAYANPIEVK